MFPKTCRKGVIFCASYSDQKRCFLPTVEKLCMHAKSLQPCPTLCDPIDHTLPGSSVQEILQARILEGVAMPSSRGSSTPRELSLLCLLHWQTGCRKVMSSHWPGWLERARVVRAPPDPLLLPDVFLWPPRTRILRGIPRLPTVPT